MIPLFGHLNPNTFMVFAGANRHLYAHIILAVYREFFGTTFFRTPLRPEVVAYIAAELRRRADLWIEDEALQELPDPPQRRGRRRLQRKPPGTSGGDLLATKANHVYARLIRCGWIEEEPFGFNTRADMPPAAMVLAQHLQLIESGLAELFGGVIVGIRSTLVSIEQDAAQNGLGLKTAGETAIGFVRHLRAIHSSLRGIERDIMQSENLDERVRTYFEDFIDKLLIRDFKTILTTNHPYRFRADIIDLSGRLLLNEPAKLKIAGAYVENNVEPDQDSAYAAVDTQLGTIQDVFYHIEEYFERINAFRARLEARLRNTVRYMERTDNSIVTAIVEVITRLEANAERAAALGVALPEGPTFLTEMPRMWAEEALAEPYETREPVKPQPLERSAEDPALQLMKRLMRQHSLRFVVRPEQVKRYLEKQVPPHGETEGQWLKIETLDDFLAFEQARRYRFGAPAAITSDFEIEPAPGEHDSAWLRCENFRVRRKTDNITLPSEKDQDAGRHTS